MIILFLLTIGIAVVINMESNVFLNGVSETTFSIAAILQLVLSMDYAIILMNRYCQGKKLEADKLEAMTSAITKSFESIVSSAATTVVGLLALIFMSFKIGADMGNVLAKGVAISMVCIFTVLPTLILGFEKLINKTNKKEVTTPMAWAGKFSYKFRHIILCVFCVLFVALWIVKGETEISYATARQNEIEDIFPQANSIRERFSKFSDHPIYLCLEEMIPKGFLFSRPVELALSLGNNLDFSVQLPLSEMCIEYCGGKEQITKVLELLKSFSEQIGYLNFFKASAKYYEKAIEKVRRYTEKYPFVTLLEEEFGVEQNTYNFILSSLMKGNYGIHFTNPDTLKVDMMSVFCTDNFSLTPAILLHEYSHPFINPLTSKYIDIVQEQSLAYEKLAQYKLPDFQSGYCDWEECVNEHFVRAMSIHLLQKCGLNDEADELLGIDLHRGYKYIPMILEKYKHYDENRHIYNNFESFYKDLLSVFSNSI